MTNVKDKLSASVKQARSQQQPLEAEATKVDVTAETTPAEAQPLPAEKPKSVPKSVANQKLPTTYVPTFAVILFPL